MPEEERRVVLVPGQIVERVRGPAQHVQAGPHAVRVVPERVDPVLLGHEQGVALRLLDEPDEEGHRRVL